MANPKQSQSGFMLPPQSQSQLGPSPQPGPSSPPLPPQQLNQQQQLSMLLSPSGNVSQAHTQQRPSNLPNRPTTNSPGPNQLSNLLSPPSNISQAPVQQLLPTLRSPSANVSPTPNQNQLSALLSPPSNISQAPTEREKRPIPRNPAIKVSQAPVQQKLPTPRSQPSNVGPPSNVSPTPTKQQLPTIRSQSISVGPLPTQQQPSILVTPATKIGSQAPSVQQQPGVGSGLVPSGAGMPLHWYVNTAFQNYLRNASSLHVAQLVEVLEIATGLETANKYTVKDQAGNLMFYVGEQSDCCSRQFCGKSRSFTLAVKDTQGLDVLRIDRQLDCSCCCALICPDSVTVSTPNGQMLGSVVEKFDLLYPKYALKDASGTSVLKLRGPFCPVAFNCLTCACESVVFQLTTPDGTPVGNITRQWSGFVREIFTDADNFSMSFPPDLDPAMKAVCLAALFLVDFQHFESKDDHDYQGDRR